MYDRRLQNKIAEYLKISKVKTEEKEDFFRLLEDYLQTAVVEFVLSRLNKKDGEKFLALSEKDKEGKVAFDFAKSLIPNLEEDINRLIKKKIEELSR